MFDQAAPLLQSVVTMSWYSFKPYVSVASRRVQVAKHAQKLAKKGVTLSPVRIEGRTIASTFWGKAWCAHLESFSDYANRLPRGRSYVRNGSVLDVQLAPGKISAMVMGSSLYHGTITVAPLKAERWQAIKAECAGKIDSLVGLLQGQLSDAVMRVITDRAKGLFPLPAEIKLKCSCPDSASLCKHLAAVLYGVGARLDTQPELLFALRGVDHLELISVAADAAALAPADAGTLDAAALSDVFGIEIEPAGKVAVPVKAKTKSKAKPVTKGEAKAAIKDTIKDTIKGAQKAKGKSQAKAEVPNTPASSRPLTPKKATKRPRNKLK